MQQKNKILFFITFLVIWVLGCQQQISRDYPMRPLPFTQVHITDDFWMPRMETNRTVTIPFAMRL